MSFAAAVDHLHALGQELAAPTAPRRKFELDHMRILARALGDPQTSFPAVLIAGTNGKGSTAATLASILSAAGYRTGLYTSPHLTRVTERIRISECREQRTGNREQAPSPSVPCSLLPVPCFTESPSVPCSLLPVPCFTESPSVPCSLLPVPCFTEIPEPDFARLYFRIDDTARRLVDTGALPHHPSFFETLTALAFLYFAGEQTSDTTRPPVDIAILEVGLGGRLDATNIVDPILSVITDIALDHQEYLGDTIAAIASEKAGILRPNGTLITLPQHPEANQAIGEAAIALNVHAINAADYLPGRNFGSSSGLQPAESVSPNSGALAPATDHFPLPLNNYTLTIDNQPLKIHSPLPGEHQQRNIALAIAAAIELRNHINYKSNEAATSSNKTGNKLPQTSSKQANSRPRNLQPATNLEPRTSNLEPSSRAIEAGIANTSWPGRLEFLPPNLLLDVAHNPAGAWTLRAAIASLPESQPRTLIFSCLRDKDLTEMAQILFPLFDSTSNLTPQTSNLAPGALNLVLTPIHNPRAASLEDLLTAARKLDIPAHTAEGPAEALALARAVTPANGLILATGSIYLIGALREQALAP